MPQNSVSDTMWPDLNETNKTPTKASLRGQYRSSLSSGQKPDRDVLFSKEINTQQVLSIRKEAVAKLTAARQQDLSTARAIIPHNPESERFQPPLGSRQTVLQPSTSNTQLKFPDEAESDIGFAPSLSLSRTSTISTSLEGSPMPSLESLLSFGDGVWGHDDIPMLRSRLSETIKECSKVDSDQQGQARRHLSPLDFGLHVDLPYTPLMDQMDLFASPTNHHSSPASGAESTISRDDTNVIYDGDTTLLDEEWKRVKETGVTGRIRSFIKAETAAICSTRLQTGELLETSHDDGNAHLRDILKDILDHLEQGKSIKG
jgi:hypothetical protein